METEPSIDEPPSYGLLMELLSASPDSFYIFGFVVIVVLLLLSGMASASEAAFFSLQSGDLDRCRDAEDRKNRNILVLLKNPRLLLATMLIIIYFLNMAMVTIATFLMWDIAQTRQPNVIVIGAVAFSLTFAIAFLGKIVPKGYAVQANFRLARMMGGIWIGLEKILAPISWVLLNMGHMVERRLKKNDHSTAEDELSRSMEFEAGGPGAAEEGPDIIKGIANFRTLTVKQIMKPRTDVAAVDYALNFHEVLAQVRKTGFSRIPAYRETLDKVEGILYTKDLLPWLGQSPDFKWQKLLRPGFFIPETKRLDSLLNDFQEKRVHIAVVVDEYGGTSGLITLEDLIEEIIGEINDEFDEEVSPYNRIDDRTFVFEGKISLHDFCKVLDVEPSTFDDVRGESESLGGLILELHSTFPAIGEKIKYKRFEFIVAGVDQKRIKRVRVRISMDEK